MILPPPTSREMQISAEERTQAALFENHLSDKDYGVAEETLAGWKSEKPSAAALAAEVRLRCHQGRPLDALQSLQLLCHARPEETAALQSAVQAFTVAGAIHEAEETLEAALRDRDVNPEAGTLWVRCFAARRAWNARGRLYSLDPHRPVGRKARIAFIEEIARWKDRPLLDRFVRREGAVLRTYSDLWAMIGFAYARVGDWRTASTWLADWRHRSDLEPWMLLNCALAQRQIGNDFDAYRASRHALTLPEDYSSPLHKIWIALDHLVVGQPATAAPLAADFEETEADAYFSHGRALAKAMLAVEEASPGEKRKVYAQQMKGLQRLPRTGLQLASMRRLHKKSLLRMASAARSTLGRVLPHIPGLGAPLASHGDKLLPIAGGAVALFIVILVLIRLISPPQRMAEPIRPPTVRQVVQPPQTFFERQPLPAMQHEEMPLPSAREQGQKQQQQ